MSFFEKILLHYQWEGVALMGLLLVMFFVQLYYYLFHYGMIPGYKISLRQPRLEKEPPVSVVVAMFAEDYAFVERRLPLLLAQEHAAFEVVIVYVGSDGDFFEDLQRIRQSFPQVVVTKIELNPRNPISPKMALNVGIKSAHYEHVILSTTDAAPTSDRWLALMAKGFTRGEVVLGYCGLDTHPSEDDEPVFRPSKVGGFLMRTSCMMHAADWMAAAIHRKPYRGSRHALGFTKKAYFERTNGFGHLDMNVGEQDLFLQKIMTSENVAVVLSPNATLREKIWGGVGWWIDQQRYLSSTRCRYSRSVINMLNWEMGSRVLFFLLVLTAVLFLPLELKLAALLLLLVRYLVVMLEVRRIGNRLGERGIWPHYYLYDLLSPLESWWVWLRLLRKDPRAWR